MKRGKKNRMLCFFVIKQSVDALFFFIPDALFFLYPSSSSSSIISQMCWWLGCSVFFLYRMLCFFYSLSLFFVYDFSQIGPKLIYDSTYNCLSLCFSSMISPKFMECHMKAKAFSPPSTLQISRTGFILMQCRVWHGIEFSFIFTLFGACICTLFRTIKCDVNWCNIMKLGNITCLELFKWNWGGLIIVHMLVIWQSSVRSLELVL